MDSGISFQPNERTDNGLPTIFEGASRRPGGTPPTDTLRLGSNRRAAGQVPVFVVVLRIFSVLAVIAEAVWLIGWTEQYGDFWLQSWRYESPALIISGFALLGLVGLSLAVQPSSDGDYDNPGVVIPLIVATLPIALPAALMASIFIGLGFIGVAFLGSLSREFF